METSFIKHFGGWSICAQDSEIKSSWKAHVAESLSEYSTDTEIPVKLGRPELAKAKSYWKSIDCEKGNQSWEQIRNLVFSHTGTKPSAKALRDWRAEFLKKGQITPRNK